MSASRRAFGIIAVAQILLVVGFAGLRQAAVSLGTEVVLRTLPVDPRDIFRGDYVVLSYEISSLDPCLVQSGETGYVALAEGQDGVWDAVPPAWPNYERAAASGGVVIRGRVTSASDGSCQLSYGIESYFVPEGTGHEIERLAGRLRVRVSVDGDGDAVIDELVPL